MTPSSTAPVFPRAPLTQKKVYELHIFSATKPSEPPVAIPLAPVAAQELCITTSGLRDLRFLSPPQLVAIKTSLAYLNSKLSIPPVSDADTYIPTQVSPTRGRQPSPVLLPITSDLETPWALEALDVPLEAHTIYRAAAPHAADEFTVNPTHRMPSAEGVAVGIKTFSPKKPEDMGQFMCLFSRDVPTRGNVIPSFYDSPISYDRHRSRSRTPRYQAFQPMRDEVFVVEDNVDVVVERRRKQELVISPEKPKREQEGKKEEEKEPVNDELDFQIDDY
ncbi:hypothetical protein EDC01DRAFT_778610 [Geopyxis carbonaria]|nr:hypothetical protein EDC01DRAFT_778610 [Geopyxis carbonaria]